jgi:hypothetical protein
MGTLNPSDWSPAPNAALEPLAPSLGRRISFWRLRELERVCQRSVSEKALLGGLG